MTVSMLRGGCAALGIGLSDTCVWGDDILARTRAGKFYLWRGDHWTPLRPAEPKQGGRGPIRRPQSRKPSDV